MAIQETFYNESLFFLCAIFILLAIQIFFNKKYKIKMNKSVSIPLLVISTYPFLWCFILKNHTIVHSWFTYRIFSITILALTYAIAYSFDIAKDKQEKRNKKENNSD